MTPAKKAPAQSIPVYRAADIRVVNGANLGDPLSFAAELDLDDTYELGLAAVSRRLSIVAADNGGFTRRRRLRAGTCRGGAAPRQLPHPDDGRRRHHRGAGDGRGRQ
ncbi:MAG: hypothetical protein M5U35_07440 [Roseovarius sp.]|nr:hypothetical protein [Roseovarius sp.]